MRDIPCLCSLKSPPVIALSYKTVNGCGSKRRERERERESGSNRRERERERERESLSTKVVD